MSSDHQLPSTNNSELTFNFQLSFCKLKLHRLFVMARCLGNILAVIAVCCVSMVYARMAYQLPDGSDSLIINVKTTFNCENRRYGYYADVDNDCKLFHVCQPIVDGEGNLLETAHFTFLCGNQTIFNQESLSCSLPEDSLACQDAQQLYEASNFNFGVVPRD